jgi:hypothetical protein
MLLVHNQFASVKSVKEIAVLIHHFDKYSLITQKFTDYFLFKQGYELIKNKKHLDIEGINKLVVIRASINWWGLPIVLKKAFPNVEPVKRFTVEESTISVLISRIVSGDGHFSVSILNSLTRKLGVQIQLKFKITQHSKDSKLLEKFLDYYNCGQVYLTKELGNFEVTKLSDFDEKIINLFLRYPIIGVKSKDFSSFCEIAKLMKNGFHLRQEGLDQIKKIKLGMNKGR